MERDHMDSGHLFFDPSLANRANLLFLGNNNLNFPGQRTTMMNMDEKLTKKRPFFTSPDEMLYDEEYYYDDQLPEKKRRLSSEQVVLLEKSFEEENKLEPERKSELAHKLGLQPRQVAVWFQNRRARSKTKQIEKEYEVLKASYDQLVIDYDTLAKENAMLKTEVELFKELCKAKEAAGSTVGPKTNLAQQKKQDGPMIAAQEQLVKVEDGQSSGSGGSSTNTSAICNEVEENFKMVMDSTGDSSYFGCLRPSPPNMAAAVEQSEEDDISKDGRSYFSNILNVDQHHEQEEEGQALGWWFGLN